MFLLPVCTGREDGVPSQSSLPHLVQLVGNKLGAIWHFNTLISVAAVGQGWNYWPKGGSAPGSWGKQTLLKADKPGSVKVREAFGECLPVNFAPCCLASPTPFCAPMTAV